MGPAEYYKSLLPTPANLAMLARWTEQDARARRAQQQLFSQVQDPVQPAQDEVKSYQSESIFLMIQSEHEPDVPLISTTALNQLVIARMISGSSTSDVSTSENIFIDAISTVHIQNEFPDVYAIKKNNRASVMGFVYFLKEKEHFVWPTTERGSMLRACLKNLASSLVAEYSVPPKLVAAIEMAALFLAAKHKGKLLSVFHAAMCTADSDFREFQKLYSNGCCDDSMLVFNPAPLLPGFDRLVRVDDSVGAWIDTASLLIDSACFQTINMLEDECCILREKWNRFAIAAKDPDSARVEELELFVQLTAASARAGIPLIDHVMRAQALLRSVTLTIKMQGSFVSVRELMRDRVAENEFGKGAVTRDLVFELYKQFYMSSQIRGCDSHPHSAPTVKQPAQGTGTGSVVLALDVASASDIPVVIVCRSCQMRFEEVPSVWAAKGPGYHMPKSCKPCLTKKAKALLETSVLITEFEMSAAAKEYDPDMSDRSDY
jgi:hypothetical protein